MAKASNEQIATCLEVRIWEKKGSDPREIYTFELDGKKFEVWDSKYFNGINPGETFRPVVVVVDSAYVGKNGRAYPDKKLIINWEKVG